MLSLHSPTACGGIGAITLMVGAVILTMAGDGTAGTVRAGALAGAAGTAVAGGDIIITITIIPDIIPVAVVIGEAAIGDRKSTRLNSSHTQKSRMPSSA